MNPPEPLIYPPPLPEASTGEGFTRNEAEAELRRLPTTFQPVLHPNDLEMVLQIRVEHATLQTVLLLSLVYLAAVVL